MSFHFFPIINSRNSRKKLALTALLLSAVLLLTGCASTGTNLTRLATVTLVPGTGSVQPDMNAPESTRTDSQVNLYFRLTDEPVLAAEARTIVTVPTQSIELALVTSLLEGPDPRLTGLNALFPEGTQVTAVSVQGSTAFVTLSREIMNGYADEPEDWQEDSYWATEVPLRRQLCMQSIVATLTENCPDIDRVQILVERSPEDTYASMRLKAQYFMTGADEDALTGPMTREEQYILSPARAAEMILTLWQGQDWVRLARYVSDAGEDFAAVMSDIPAAAAGTVQGGSISPDGNTATFTASLTAQDDTEKTVLLRLYRSSGIWQVTTDQLTGWQEE